MSNKCKLFCIAAGMILLSGCAAWQLVKTPREWKSGKLSAQLPAGWMKFNSPQDLLFLTKDGEMLQLIRVFSYKYDNDKEFPLTKKKLAKNMLAQETADLIINELSLSKDLVNLQITENIPAEIGGEQGFKIVYAYNTPESLEVKVILYGFQGGDFVYLFQYQAAKQYYFEKDIAIFDKFIMSLRVYD